MPLLITHKKSKPKPKSSKSSHSHSHSHSYSQSQSLLLSHPQPLTKVTTTWIISKKPSPSSIPTIPPPAVPSAPAEPEPAAEATAAPSEPAPETETEPEREYLPWTSWTWSEAHQSHWRARKEVHSGSLPSLFSSPSSFYVPPQTQV